MWYDIVKHCKFEYNYGKKIYNLFSLNFVIQFIFVDLPLLLVPKEVYKVVYVE